MKNANIVDEFEQALIEFVKRASSEGATAEELKTLPAVATVLASWIAGRV